MAGRAEAEVANAVKAGERRHDIHDDPVTTTIPPHSFFLRSVHSPAWLLSYVCSVVLYNDLDSCMILPLLGYHDLKLFYCRLPPGKNRIARLGNSALPGCYDIATSDDWLVGCFRPIQISQTYLHSKSAFVLEPGSTFVSRITT